jgi:TRAP-type C4-dicarboxylate transport system permease small subunit
MKNFRIFVHYLQKIQELWGVILFIGLTMVITLQVLSRYVFNFPIIWSEEVGRYLLFWVALTGAAISVKRKRHFVIDFFDINSITNPPLKLTLMIIPDVCILLIGIIMVFNGYDYYQSAALRMGRMIAISMQYVFAALPITGATIVIYSMFNLLETVTSYKKSNRGDV